MMPQICYTYSDGTGYLKIAIPKPRRAGRFLVVEQREQI